MNTTKLNGSSVASMYLPQPGIRGKTEDQKLPEYMYRCNDT